MSKTITLSERTHAEAEKQARAEGFASVDAYLDALIAQDREDATVTDWMRARLAEGLASPSAGPITQEKIDRLVGEGIALAARKG